MENIILGIIFVLSAMALVFLPTVFRSYVMQKCYEVHHRNPYQFMHHFSGMDAVHIDVPFFQKPHFVLIQYISLFVVFPLGNLLRDL